MRHVYHELFMVTFFQKPHRVPLMLLGDVELRSPLEEEVVCRRELLVCVQNDGLDLCVITVPTKHVQPLYPFMGRGIIDYLG